MSIDRCAYTNAKNNSREEKTFGENLGTAWRCHPNISTNGMCFHDECELRKTIYRVRFSLCTMLSQNIYDDAQKG